MSALRTSLIIIVGYVLCVGLEFVPARGTSEKEQTQDPLTYAKDVAPVIKTYCLPCHGSDNENASDLYMDDYATMMKGGKHGVPVVAWKPDSSNLYLKLTADPPFGKQMPKGRKKITPEAVKIIHDWIAQGAREQ